MTLRTKAENLTLRAHCCAAPGKKGESTRASRASQSRRSSRSGRENRVGKVEDRPSHQQWEESRAGLATTSSLLPGDLGSEF